MPLFALPTLPTTLFSKKGAHPQFVAANVVTAVFTPVLLGAGLLIGRFS